MLHEFELSNISEIVELAATRMSELNFSSYMLVSVAWDDNESEWCVKFYSDYGTFEYTTVSVVEIGDAKYRLAGHRHEND